jgi:CRISPR/Cas system CSM-associated protein Csm3 (group 7 of RAMP superfamily)
MKTIWLKITLKSDTTFGRGDGVAGLVDAEVQHDENGLPYLGGKTLKGLLGTTCDEILNSPATSSYIWTQSRNRLFGAPGSGVEEAAGLHVGHALLPEDLRQTIAYSVYYGRLDPKDVLASLTTLRRQTAMDAGTGAPLQETLRTMRVIVRETPFISRLNFKREPEKTDLALLAACVKALRRAGTGRNRGRGRLIAELYEVYPGVVDSQPVTDSYFAHFQEALQS